jgi:HSP90 family molecular chaperone
MFCSKSLKTGISECSNSLKGIVDSYDIPLIISIEQSQQNGVMKSN